MKPVRKRGISDVIATVIIVAATVAIALIAVSYFTGIIGGSTKTERVQILPVSSIIVDSTNNKICTQLYVKNSGGGPSTLKYVQLNGVMLDFINTTDQLTIPPGETAVIFAKNTTSMDVVPGAVYSVSVTTEAGFQTTVDLKAVSGTCP